MERRKASRYGLRVPALFSSEDTPPMQGEGVTRDISASSAYVVLCEKSTCPAQGDIVAIQLILPSIADMEARGIKLNFKGQVLRTGHSPEERGFAVLAECMELGTGNKNSGQGKKLP